MHLNKAIDVVYINYANRTRGDNNFEIAINKAICTSDMTYTNKSFNFFGSYLLLLTAGMRSPHPTSKHISYLTFNLRKPWSGRILESKSQ